MIVLVSRFEIVADCSCHYVSDLATGQSAHSIGVMCANMHVIRVKGQPWRHGWSEFFFSVLGLQILNWLYCIESIVVWAKTVFTMVDILRLRLCLSSLRLFTGLTTRSICLPSQTVTLHTHVCTCCRAFHKAAPVLWNTLPPTVKTASSSARFKTELKTHLFKAALL